MKSEDGLFQPSLELSSFNASTFAVSSLPMQPLTPELNKVQDRLSISFEEDFNDDIGNIDYSVPWGGGGGRHAFNEGIVGGSREALEEDMRRVRKLLDQVKMNYNHMYQGIKTNFSIMVIEILN